eukprot:1161909-Pelagomonas_calceolata.AAC.2
MTKVARVSVLQTSNQGSSSSSSNSKGGRGLGGGGSMFASMSFGMGGASHAVLGVLTRAAGRAASRRPHVLRPSHVRASTVAKSGGDVRGRKSGGVGLGRASMQQQDVGRRRGIAGLGGLMAGGPWARQQQQQQH